jgi:hypothetical protein
MIQRRKDKRRKEEEQKEKKLCRFLVYKAFQTPVFGLAPI